MPDDIDPRALVAATLFGYVPETQRVRYPVLPPFIPAALPPLERRVDTWTPERRAAQAERLARVRAARTPEERAAENVDRKSAWTLERRLKQAEQAALRWAAKTPEERAAREAKRLASRAANQALRTPAKSGRPRRSYEEMSVDERFDFLMGRRR